MLDEAKEVCPTTTRRLLDKGALMVDVREPYEIKEFAFDVPSLLTIPLSELEQRWQEIPRECPVIFVCEGGMRSLKATYYLQFHGYTNVINMAGGILKWHSKGFPVKGRRAADAPTPSAKSCCC